MAAKCPNRPEIDEGRTFWACQFPEVAGNDLGLGCRPGYRTHRRWGRVNTDYPRGVVIIVTW